MMLNTDIFEEKNLSFSILLLDRFMKWIFHQSYLKILIPDGTWKSDNT
jgi:hypothetical protein